ncbi:hypothetical protein VNO77_35595 [Canavalia gladiata]|uniref:Uncharacterized protein n=1 Tax=Canavalia gladiata TaxID=3824 RepID=A0AAN9K8U5_CANGL
MRCSLVWSVKTETFVGEREREDMHCTCCSVAPSFMCLSIGIKAALIHYEEGVPHPDKKTSEGCQVFVKKPGVLSESESTKLQIWKLQSGQVCFVIRGPKPFYFLLGNVRVGFV